MRPMQQLLKFRGLDLRQPGVEMKGETQARAQGDDDDSGSKIFKFKPKISLSENCG